jgi:polyisoprenoid-binding protein YceI
LTQVILTDFGLSYVCHVKKLTKYLIKTKNYFMKQMKRFFFLVLAISGTIYMTSCRHEDQILSSNGPAIERGTQVLNLPTDTKLTFEKSHSNVMWETPYMGALATLTGRFDTFGVTKFNFDEANPANTNFDCWVWLNRVNTSEPGRDKGCLQTTFGVNTSMTTETANVAKFTSTKVELSTTDKGYIVTGNLTFHGVTKEITGKLMYLGKVTTGSGATTKYKYGVSFTFQFLAITDFALATTNIADQVTIRCDATFTQLP